MMLSIAAIYFLGQDKWIEMHDLFGYVMPLTLHNNGAVNGTDASTGTNTSTKGHKIYVNNHLNITNAMVLLMAPPESYYCHVHDKTTMPLKCHV